MCHFNRLVDVPKLLYYADSSNGRPGFGATVKMESGETYSVSFAHNGVLVKKTRFGIFGPKIYEVEDFGEMVEMVEKLNDLFPENKLPVEFENPIIRAFANAIWQSYSCSQLSSFFHI